MALAVAALACREASKTPPAPVSPPQVPSTLTEKDTLAHDGGVAGPGWRLGLDARWLLVRPDVSTRVKPGVQAWAVDPDGPEHLTVTCRAGAGGPGLPTGTPVEPLRGPWLEGQLARFQAGDGAHTRARYVLLSQTCDVDVVTPPGGDGARAAQAVGRFESDRRALVSALVELAQYLQTDPQAKARLNLYRDAGHGDISGLLLMDNALVRLAPARLTERFTLRQSLLEALPPLECGELVRHRLDPAPELLERLPEESAVRWVGLTREALGLALGSSTPPSLPTEAEVEAAIRELVVQDRALEAAVLALQRPGNVPSEVLCDAERRRLRAILAQPEPKRVVLMKSLVAGTAPSP
ncbi:MAG: hypothetical protein SFW67_25655 [Myxococcaceae bacterium]|nr:hypothetical protein [Myxococcaceae bacterium]